jgi:tricorn protease
LSAPVGYYRHPSIHGDVVIFVSEDDLWSVPSTGGQATRLTANAGPAILPKLSPDGKMVAFSSRDEGPLEASVIDITGGPARRLTWFGSTTMVVGWSGDGESVIVSSDREQPFPSLMSLWSIPLDGSPPHALPYGPARSLACEPGGAGVVIGRNTIDPARWKRYRGGSAGQLWIDRSGRGQFERLIELDGSLASPMWIGRRIYFISDHEGHGNIYSCTPMGRNLQRHTDHSDFYARFPDTDGSSIIYHAGADLWRFDTDATKPEQVDVTLSSSRPARNRSFESATRHLESIDLHPKGQSVAVTARGTVQTMDLWEGAPLPLNPTSTTRDRLATWLPDGERIVAVTDESGEEQLVVMAADGTGERRSLLADIGRPFWIEAAPAGADRVAVLNERQEVIIVNLRSGQAKVVARSSDNRPGGMSWSSDGRWLAYSADATPRTSAIFVHDTTTGRTRQVTSGDFIDEYPSFDPGGAYLYFLSLRTFNPVGDPAFFDFGFPKGGRPYVLPLEKSTPSPFSVEMSEARPVGAPPTQNGNGDAKVDEPTPVAIDFSGIEERLIAVPVPEARYTAVRGATGRMLFSSLPVTGAFAESGTSDPQGLLQSWDFAKLKVEKVVDGISSFAVSHDGNVLGIRSGAKFRAVPVAFKEESPGPEEFTRETGWVNMARLRVEVDPGEEWHQMASEAWRLQRDQFWVANMSGVDWKGVFRRYRPLIDRVGTRGEFSDFMWEMQGELGTSHAYEMGGDYLPTPHWNQGFLGADVEFDRRSNSWRIGRVPNGDAWLPNARSPLSASGVDVQPGDRLVAVDGVAVNRAITPSQRLTDRAGRTVNLTVKRGRRKERTVAVTTLRSEGALRYRDWVEGNRRAVHEATRGKAGYLHLPDMGSRGYSEFHRYFPVEVTRIGLVIDVRFNGGGNVSQLLLQKLLRKRIGYDRTRHADQLVPYPADSPLGPMVALTNEFAGSDGDIFSHAFKMYGLGPLIGTRTWGGVIGIWPRHALVDGTLTTQPEFSYWFSDVGWNVENYGTDPDIVVEYLPQDYAAGRDPQLERGISEVMAQIDDLDVVLPDMRRRNSRKIPKLPPR